MLFVVGCPLIGAMEQILANSLSLLDDKLDHFFLHLQLNAVDCAGYPVFLLDDISLGPLRRFSDKEA